MPLAKIQQLLKNKIGLDTRTVGISMLQSGINKRMQDIKLNSIEEYAVLLASSDKELNILINDITVPETWFFRDTAPFETLKEFALAFYAKPHNKRPLRVLSIPSSTGEEPYSIAMSLCEIGIPQDKFTIHAIDICARSLEAAARAIYTKNSFRGKQRNEIIELYFNCDNGLYLLADRIKGMVDFSHGNIIDPGLVLPHTCYDVIFCRNLLIYFDKNNKDIAFKRLHSLLDDDGILFIGHSESGSVQKELFSHAGISKSFAYLKTKNNLAHASHKAPATSHYASDRRKRFAPTSITTKRKASVSSITIPDVDGKQGKGLVGLEKAQQLANMGQFKEALDICSAHVNAGENNPEAYYLLGIINASSNNYDDAVKYLRKTIYLAPRHYDALLHLSLILEKTGKSTEAQLLRKRAERSAPSSMEARHE